MSDANEWGPGELAKTAQAFDRVLVDETAVDLVWGEHPHSRQDDRCYARWPDGRIEAFDGHRVHVEIITRTHNYLKQSGLSGNEVRKGGQCLIRFNGHDVYGFFFREVENALLKAARLVTDLKEHSANLWQRGGPEFGLIGRRVYYHETPATIVNFFGDQGCVVLQSAIGYFQPPVWMKDDGEEMTEQIDRTKTDVLSPHIWWWRKRLMPGERDLSAEAEAPEGGSAPDAS